MQRQMHWPDKERLSAGAGNQAHGRRMANPTHIPRVQHCGGRASRARGDPRAARPDSAATIRRMVDSGNAVPSLRSSRVGHGDFPVSASETGSEKCRRYQRQTRSPFSTIPTTWRACEFVANSGQFGTRRDRSNEFFLTFAGTGRRISEFV